MATAIDFEKHVMDAYRAAAAKARSVGYAIESMRAVIEVDGDVCTVRFEPIPPPGHVTFGGDLTVEVDLRTNTVLSLQRGQ